MTDLPNLTVLYEDNHCLVVFKPPGLLTHPDETDDPSLADLVRAYLKTKYHKPGQVYLGIVHRLDRPTSGVVLFARTSKAAGRLHAQFRQRDVTKTYWAIVHGRPDPPEGRLEHYLRKHDEKNIVHVVGPECPGAKPAALRYRVLEPGPPLSLVEVCLETGRTHQIRAQLSEAGWPIAGDVKYGSPLKIGRWFALHHRSLEFEHPTRREPVCITAAPPPEWQSFGVPLPVP